MQARANSPLTQPRNIIWIGLTIISVTLFVAIVQVASSVRDLQFQLASFEQTSPGGDSLSPARLRASLAAVKNDMAVIRADAGWVLPILPAFGWLPQFGGDLSQADALFGMTDSLVLAADAVFGTWVPVLDAHNAAQGSQTPAGLDQTIAAASPAFLLGRAYMARADGYRARIQPERLSVRTASILDRIDKVLPLMQLAVEGSLALPDLVGASTPRNYLIVAQNEDERRATGGFVSAAGLLTIERGRITALEFMDSYQVDDLSADFPQPPEPIQRYLLGGYWLFRDANWSPDFPTSARQLAALYELGKHKHVDGVIAIDQEMVRLIVAAVGPVDVPADPPIVVTGDTLLNYMRESWAAPFTTKSDAAVLQRKSFIGLLAKSLQEQVMGGGQVNMGALAKAIYDGLHGKHLLVYLPDSPLAGSLARSGWDGALQPHAGDYAMVVDSNLGFNKANALVTQVYNYSVSIAPDHSAQAALDISYDHHGNPSGKPCVQKSPDYIATTTYSSLMNLCLWDYLRVHVPAGSTLIDATRFPIPAQQMMNHADSSGDPQAAAAERNTEAFSAFFAVDLGEHKDFQFRYNLPPGAVQRTADGLWLYSLVWQKQPGTPVIPLHIVLTLPPGAIAQRASPVPAAQVAADNESAGTQLTYAIDLAGDMTLQVAFR